MLSKTACARIKLFRAKTLVNRIASTSALPYQDDEYTAVPNYPPILDLSPEKVYFRKKQVEYDEIKAVKTVEEKQIKLNMPKYYGFKCHLLKENIAPYNGLALAQHVTRTHVIETNSLPEFYDKIDVDSICQNIKGEVEEALLFEYEAVRRKEIVLEDKLSPSQLEDLLSTAVAQQINRIILNSVDHLKSTQLDYDPRIEAFWWVGSLETATDKDKTTPSTENDSKKEEYQPPLNRAMHYFGQPILTVRHELPLPPVVPESEAENASYQVPYYKYDPEVTETKIEYLHGANIPGFWPGAQHRFGIVSYHRRGHMLERNLNYVPEREYDEALIRQAMLASFSWLNSQANFLGFTTYNDITYPLTTQTIITNGQRWLFNVYQMNTMLLHSKYVSENPKTNLMWALQELKLFESIENGKIVGFNDEVIKTLLKFYANKPQERLGVNLTPYLSATEKVIADYQDDDKRNWLEREYKHIVSHRPRHKPLYEIYDWEKIYKIQFKTRPMDKKLRPFELGIDVWDRRLNERQPRYIPRALRPDLPRHKGRYAKEYWP